jgi:hypothetical protein
VYDEVEIVTTSECDQVEVVTTSVTDTEYVLCIPPAFGGLCMVSSYSSQKINRNTAWETEHFLLRHSDIRCEKITWGELSLGTNCPKEQIV